MTGVLFYEEQRFNQPWLWIILILLNLLFAWGIIQQMVFGIPLGDRPLPNSALIAMEAIPFSLFVFFWLLNLKTIITQDQVEIIFVPFVKKIYKWEAIEKSYVRTYKPIGEFGGWGVRFGRKGSRAFNVRGNIGLQLELKNGKKVLIGTQKQEELERLLPQII